MKFTVAVALVGLTECSGVPVVTHVSQKVESQEMCLELAKQYSELPFVKSTNCIVEHTERSK